MSKTVLTLRGLLSAKDETQYSRTVTVGGLDIGRVLDELVKTDHKYRVSLTIFEEAEDDE